MSLQGHHDCLCRDTRLMKSANGQMCHDAPSSDG